ELLDVAGGEDLVAGRVARVDLDEAGQDLDGLVVHIGRSPRGGPGDEEQCRDEAEWSAHEPAFRERAAYRSRAAGGGGPARTLVLAHEVRLPPPARPRLRRGLRDRRQPMAASARRARPPARARVAGGGGRLPRANPRDVPPVADALPLRRLRRGLPDRRLRGPAPLPGRPRGLRERAHPRLALAPLH